MPKYSYQAKSSKGVLSQGDIDAANENDARTKLRAQGLEPISVTMAVRKQVQVKKRGFFEAKVKGKDLQVFTRQFATLINAGIPIVDALKILSEGLRVGVLKDATLHVKTSIESGRRLAEAMAQKPGVFDKLFCNMIQAGEEAGILDSILGRLAAYIEKNEKIKSQVKGALLYPAVILCVAFFVIVGILIFIIPKFQQFFSSAGKELPFLTQVVVRMSETMTHYWYVIVAIIVGGPIAFMQWLETPAGKDSFDQILMKTPIFGEVLKKSALARLSRTMSTLLASGVGMLEAIEISGRTADNKVIERAMARAKDMVSQGKPLAQPLSREKEIMPDMVVQMIAIGEQSGTLDTMLGKIADFYEDEVDIAVKAMTSLIEPMLMVFLGAVIAFIVIAMYLPVFNMGDTVGGM